MSDSMLYCGAFPYRITSGTPSGAAGFSCIMPYEDARYCWWRVKNWTVSTNVESKDKVFSITTPLYNGTLDEDSSPAITRERDLSRRGAVAKHFKKTPPSDGGIGFSLGGSIIKSAGQYYPFSQIVAGTAGGGFGLSLTTDDSGTPDFSFAATIFGAAIPIYVTIGANVDTYTASSLVLTPIEWWPYAARADGTPIWNAATGANLQDPTN